MKKIIAVIMSAMLLCNMGITSQAIPTEVSSNSEKKLVGLVAPSSITRDGYKPVQAYNVATEGTYELDGSSDRTDLYSLYYFTGKSSYHIGLHNRQASKQKFVCKTYDGDETIYSGSIPASDICQVDLETDEGWYIVFTNGVFGDGVDVWGLIY